MKKDKSRHLSEVERLLGVPNETRKLSQRTKDNIVKLRKLARNGSQDAAIELHFTAETAVDILNDLCIRRPQLFKPIARENFRWPFLYSLHPEEMRETAAFLKQMELGGNTHINFSSGKTFSWRVPANFVALNLSSSPIGIRM